MHTHIHTYAHIHTYNVNLYRNYRSRLVYGVVWSDGIYLVISMLKCTYMPTYI